MSDSTKLKPLRQQISNVLKISASAATVCPLEGGISIDSGLTLLLDKTSLCAIVFSLTLPMKFGPGDVGGDFCFGSFFGSLIKTNYSPSLP